MNRETPRVILAIAGWSAPILALLTLLAPVALLIAFPVIWILTAPFSRRRARIERARRRAEWHGLA